LHGILRRSGSGKKVKKTGHWTKSPRSAKGGHTTRVRRGAKTGSLTDFLSSIIRRLRPDELAGGRGKMKVAEKLDR